MSKEKTAISGKKVKQNLFKEGYDPRRNLDGKPKGTKSFDTLFAEAIRKIAKEKKLNMKSPETEMVVKAVVEALKGNYSYFRDIMDRRYGRPKEKLELEGELKLPVRVIKIKKYE